MQLIADAVREVGGLVTGVDMACCVTKWPPSTENTHRVVWVHEITNSLESEI